jgi:gas vesicle protein
LNYLVTYAPTIAVDGDAQLECAVKLMTDGEQAAKDFAKEINNLSKEVEGAIKEEENKEEEKDEVKEIIEEIKETEEPEEDK